METQYSVARPEDLVFEQEGVRDFSQLGSLIGVINSYRDSAWAIHIEGSRGGVYLFLGKKGKKISENSKEGDLPYAVFGVLGDRALKEAFSQAGQLEVHERTGLETRLLMQSLKKLFTGNVRITGYNNVRAGALFDENFVELGDISAKASKLEWEILRSLLTLEHESSEAEKQDASGQERFLGYVGRNDQLAEYLGTMLQINGSRIRVDLAYKGREVSFLVDKSNLSRPEIVGISSRSLCKKGMQPIIDGTLDSFYMDITDLFLEFYKDALARRNTFNEKIPLNDAIRVECSADKSQELEDEKVSEKVLFNKFLLELGKSIDDNAQSGASADN